MSQRWTGCGALLAALIAWLAAAPPAGASIELLHVEANEGGSSGGHAALRLGAATYHFQNAGGLLLLAREGSRSFVRDYALLQNRPIHVLGIEVAPEAERAVRERFQERLAAQRSQLDALAVLRAERDLLTFLLRSARGEAAAGEGLAIPGAGYFEGAAPAGVEIAVQARTADPALAALREAVARQRGEGFFARRQRELRDEMAGLELEPGGAAAPLPPLDAYAALSLSYGFGARYADLAAAQVALAVLAEARGLRAGALRSGEDPSLHLSPEAARALRAFADQLRAALLRRLSAARLDSGRALVVGMARLAAVERSLREGRLRVLDAFGDGVPTLDAVELARRRELLPAIAAETGSAARAALRRFTARGGGEAAYADLEDAVNRHLELVGAWREGRALRAQPERLVPARGAPLREPVALRAGTEALARALAAASERERGLTAEIERLHGYHLLAHNCVSELFATLESAFGSRERAADALGGRVGRGAGPGAIPFVAAARAARRYHIGDVHTIPSLRGARLARMRAAEGGLRVALRESSPLTARAGRRGSRDSFFLFYTDHVFWPRPLLGALNLAAGAGEAALGLLRAPLDGGRSLVRGLHGALMSLPELAFVNLRKGTNDWVPESAWQEIDVPADPDP